MARKKDLDTSKLTQIDFSLEEAAFVLGRSKDKLRKLAQSGEISAYKTTGSDKGHWRFSLRALQEYQEEQEIRRAA